jgi:hypothetical protein
MTGCVYIYIFNGNINTCMSVSHLSRTPNLSYISIRNILRTKASPVDMVDPSQSVYAYQPSHAAPIILSIILGASLGFHIYQGL